MATDDDIGPGSTGRPHAAGRRASGSNAAPAAADGTERRARQSELRRTLRQRFPERGRDNLLPALHLLQHEYGYLPEWALQVVGWHLRTPASEVYGAATSYSELRLAAPSELAITVCTGLACWSAGSEELLTAAREQLAGDAAGSVAVTACAFVCGVAPAVGVAVKGAPQRWLGRMDAARLLAAIAEAGG